MRIFDENSAASTLLPLLVRLDSSILFLKYQLNDEKIVWLLKNHRVPHPKAINLRTIIVIIAHYYRLKSTKEVLLYNSPGCLKIITVTRLL
jgi:hypothetical protein